MLRLNERITSVDTPLGGDSEKALLDILADEKENGPEDTTQDDDMKQSIVKWLFELNAKQREVLARRFGLLGYEAATLEDVGREIDHQYAFIEVLLLADFAFILRRGFEGGFAGLFTPGQQFLIIVGPVRHHTGGEFAGDDVVHMFLEQGCHDRSYVALDLACSSHPITTPLLPPLLANVAVEPVAC